MELQGNLSSLRAFGEWYGARFAVLHSPYLIVACGCALALLCLYALIVGEPPRESKPPLRRYPHSALAVVADGSRDKSDKAWRRELSREAYASLRQRITDEPNLLVSQGGLTDLFEYGVFRCAGCGAALRQLVVAHVRAGPGARRGTRGGAGDREQNASPAGGRGGTD